MNQAHSKPLLASEGLCVRYRGQTNDAVHDVTFEVAAGEIVAVVGESGCGKSTMLASLARLLPGDTAEVRASSLLFAGQRLLELGPRQLATLHGGGVASVFQNPRASLDPVRTVGAQVAEVLRLHRRRSRREATIEAVRMLERAGMDDAIGVSRRWPHQLSGGQCQRVVIALALACDPRLLLADEPTTALDVTTERRILERFVSLARDDGLAIVFVSHDLRVVDDIADRVLVLDNGCVVEHGPTSRVFAAPAHAATRRLLLARPRLGAAKGPFGLDRDGDADVDGDGDDAGRAGDTPAPTVNRGVRA